MSQWLLNTFPTWLLALAFVTVLVGFTLVMSRVVRRVFLVDRGEGHNDVVGMTFTTVGVVYAVILAFVVVTVWTAMDKSTEIVTDEAAALVALYRDTGAFRDPFRTDTRQKIKDYTTLVKEDEWPLLARGEQSEKARAGLNALFVAYRTFEPQGDRELAWYGESLQQLNLASIHRTHRTHESQGQLPEFFWAILIFGGFLTVAIGTFLHLPDARLKDLLLSSVALITALLLFLVLVLDAPFSGDVKVGTESLDIALESMAKAP